LFLWSPDGSRKNIVNGTQMCQCKKLVQPLNGLGSYQGPPRDIYKG
jgi:hypothetical protein